MSGALPDWVVLHLPHDSTQIPDSVRPQFVLDDAALAKELLKMTDHFTCDLFGAVFSPHQTVRASVSRLVVDVERFENDKAEPMSFRGMGAVYQLTHAGERLRGQISDAQRKELMKAFYFPHHQALQAAVERALAVYDLALVLDAHSFPCKPLPYEIDQTSNRPEICIGTDDFHTPFALLSCLQDAFRAAGFTVAINSPFSGSLVPLRYYRTDARVRSVMIEVRRDIYMDELTGEKLAGFTETSNRITSAFADAITFWTRDAYQ
jgi:N-formylglutamate amidohydrolase